MFCVQLLLFSGLFILIDYVQLQKCHYDLCFDSIKSVLCPHYFAWNCLTLNSYLNSDKLIFHNNVSLFHISHILVHTVSVLQFHGYPKVLGFSPTFPNRSLPDLISFLTQVKLVVHYIKQYVTFANNFNLFLLLYLFRSLAGPIQLISYKLIMLHI